MDNHEAKIDQNKNEEIEISEVEKELAQTQMLNLSDSLILLKSTPII